MWRSFFDLHHFHGLFLIFSGCQSFRLAVEVYLIRRLPIQAGMGSLLVEELDVTADAAPCCGDRFVSMQIDLFIFDGTPEAFDEDVVSPASLAIHADPDAFLLEPIRKRHTGELAALIGVEDLRFAVFAKSLIECLQAERHIHGV